MASIKVPTGTAVTCTHTRARTHAHTHTHQSNAHLAKNILATKITWACRSSFANSRK